MPWWMRYRNLVSFHRCARASLRPGWSRPIATHRFADTVLAPNGYDADERVIERLESLGKTPVIPPKGNRTRPRDYDRDLYKARQRK